MGKLIKPEFKNKVFEELRELIFLTVYLTLFLNSLAVYRSLILDQNVFSFFHLGYNLVEALLLAKIILLGKMLHLGEKYDDQPLIIPAIYRALVFSVFVFIFNILEHFILGFIEGKGINAVWEQFASHGVNQSIGKLLIAFLVFVLLFSFLKIIQVFGEEKFFNLFFHRRKDS